MAAKTSVGASPAMKTEGIRNRSESVMKKGFLILLCLCLVLSLSFAHAEEGEEKQYIGIISAMENEVKLLLSEANIDHIDTVGNVDYHIGTLCDRNVIIAQGGIGKVLSASASSVMLSRYPVSHLIFTGIAGGVGNETEVLDVVIANELTQHDYGTITQDGFEWMPPSGSTGFYMCDPSLVKAAQDAATEVVGEEHVFRGLVASGDQFVASEEYVSLLQKRFGAIACEMEGASVACVCERFGVPFVVIRTMSDKADGNAHESIKNMQDLAADHSGRIVMKMLENFDDSADAAAGMGKS